MIVQVNQTRENRSRPDVDYLIAVFNKRLIVTLAQILDVPLIHAEIAAFDQIT
jgi:hypothetical protein